MKVLQLNFEKTWRGGERQTILNAIGIRNEFIGVEFLCRADSPLAFKAKEAGFTIHTFSNILGVIAFLAFRGKEFGILHTQTAHMLTYCAATKWFHGCKIVFTRRIIPKPQGRLTLWKYRCADRIVAISKAIQKTVSEFTHHDVVLISDAIETGFIHVPKNFNLLANTPEAAGKKVILTVAAMTPDKDPLMLVKAITELSNYRKDFILIHLGDGPYRDKITKLISQNAIKDFYRCIGYTDLISAYFSVAEVFVLSSKQEGLGSSVLDAFYQKVPAATTDSGGLAELLDENRGLLSSVGDYQQLARNINTLLDNEELRNQMAEKAYEYVVNNHSIAAIGKKYSHLFQELNLSRK